MIRLMPSVMKYSLEFSYLIFSVINHLQIDGSLMEEFVKLGGHQCGSPLEAGKGYSFTYIIYTFDAFFVDISTLTPFHLFDSFNAGVEALIVLISHADQIHDVFFSSEGVCNGIIKILTLPFFGYSFSG